MPDTTTRFTLLTYTVKGEPEYTNTAQPGLTGKKCDLDDSIHLAIWDGNGAVTPLLNGTGVIFAEADYANDIPQAVTKTFIDPWAFRMKNGNIAFCAIQRNENAPDPTTQGSVAIILSSEFPVYNRVSFIKVSNGNIKNPTCQWLDHKNKYLFTWVEDGKTYQGYSLNLCEIFDIVPSTSIVTGHNASEKLKAQIVAGSICGALAGNLLSLDQSEASALFARYGSIRQLSVDPMNLQLASGKSPTIDELPDAICRYSDGSTHRKKVTWDLEQLQQINWATAGHHVIHGIVQNQEFQFPFIDEFVSDPCICNYNGLFFMSSTQTNTVTFRTSRTIEGLRYAKPYDVFRIEGGTDGEANLWAQEMHVIKGIPYIFTTVGLDGWSSVQCHVLRCIGDPTDPSSWETPRLVIKANGKPLYDENGIGLDMTYFEVNGVHYVMWSGRTFLDKTSGHEIARPADVLIATVDPDSPWKLTSEPQLIARPMYGWDRCESEVVEGPYLLRHQDDLFVTISGSSTALPDLYCIGLLHAKAGTNLLNPENWSRTPYPILTKESVTGEFGPGHNMFIKDPVSGDDLFVYHAVPHDDENKAIGRRMGIRRVHWTAEGLPCLDMTSERDLDPLNKNVSLDIVVI